MRVNHNHDDNGVAEIIRILGVIGDSEAGPALAELLYSAKEPEIRIAIIETLGLIGEDAGKHHRGRSHGACMLIRIGRTMLITM